MNRLTLPLAAPKAHTGHMHWWTRALLTLTFAIAGFLSLSIVGLL